MNIIGKVVHIGETSVISDKFRKRDIVIEHGDNPQYLQNCIFECHQDKVDLLDSVKVGNQVKVEFNLHGRAWTNPQGIVKYFNTLACWKIENAGTSDITPEIKDPEWMGTEGEDNTLPF